MTSFLLADDQQIVRYGLKSFIRENLNFEVIHEAKHVNDIVRMINNYHYDVLILDISMPEINFTNLIHWISTMTIGPRILIFTSLPENVYGLPCIQLGAHGFLSKSSPNTEIISAIAKLLEGKKYVSAALTEKLLEGSGDRFMTNPFQQLSTREMEIVLLLNSGKTLPEISSQLNIQYTTANTYKRRIFEKLQVNNVLSLAQLLQTYDVGK